jgi:hypothetical protein
MVRSAGILVALIVTTTAAAAGTPAQTLAAALAAARAQQSVHYVVAQASPTVSTGMVGDAARDRGIQRITYRNGGKTGHVTVIVVANTAYVRGDAFTLEHYMGLPAATASSDAGKWLRLVHTSPGFATVAEGVRISSTIGELAMSKSLTAIPATTVAGRRVIGIQSKFTSSGHAITETLYVSASGTPLPVEQLTVSGPVAVRVRFSRWNEAVRLSAPSSSIALR